MGVQYGSDAEKIALFDVLNERYDSRMPTIFISNLDKNGVAESLGERVFDRLREDNGRVIAFKWESERHKIAMKIKIDDADVVVATTPQELNRALFKRVRWGVGHDTERIHFGQRVWRRSWCGDTRHGN